MRLWHWWAFRALKRAGFSEDFLDEVFGKADRFCLTGPDKDPEACMREKEHWISIVKLVERLPRSHQRAIRRILPML